jgi:DNA polymerase III delta subunit
MLTILHGDNTEESRAELVKLVAAAKGRDMRRLEGKNLEPASLAQALESSSLFGGNVCVVVENLFSKVGKKQKLAQEYAAILTRAPAETQIIVWEEKELSATALKTLAPKAHAQLFKTPSVIFQLLDGLRPNAASGLLFFYEKAIAAQAPELVFAMLVRRVRQLLMVKGGVAPDGMQGWQEARLTNQARAFTMEQLVRMHKTLLAAEYSLKSGASPFSMIQLTQQWIAALE